MNTGSQALVYSFIHVFHACCALRSLPNAGLVRQDGQTPVIRDRCFLHGRETEMSSGKHCFTEGKQEGSELGLWFLLARKAGLCTQEDSGL